MSSIISNTKVNMILQFKENISQLISCNAYPLVILAFKPFNELGLVAYTIVFACPYKKNLVKSNLANVEAMGIKVILKKNENIFLLI